MPTIEMILNTLQLFISVIRRILQDPVVAKRPCIMIKLLFFLLISNVQYSIGQTVSDTVPVLTVGTGIDRVKEREDKITSYADSINNYVSGAIPSFLYYECFDLQSFLWQGFHASISLRWKVLEKVSNKAALKKILVMQDERLNQKCNAGNYNPGILIPMIDKSFSQLLLKRFKELNKRQCF